MGDLLRVKNLSVSYRNLKMTTPVIKNLNFSISSGEILVLVGDSGSGKSTLGKALSGLLAPSTEISGELIFKDQVFQLANPQFKWAEIRGKKLDIYSRIHNLH
ncbi:MAG: ATP-binding cassette domain-containing protein [Eubacteriales bacterium]|nr:ATP-binding cassette domain-containing protein [Eubacteriales bacterium]